MSDTRPLGLQTIDIIAADIKARGFDPQAAYGQFVIARGLKPEIDAKQFLAIYQTVAPARYRPAGQSVDYTRPTHLLVGDGAPKRITILTDAETHIKWIDDTGMMGGTPRKLIVRLVELSQDAEKPQERPAEPPR